MNCIIRKWRLSDAKDLASALNNGNILNKLRDGLPFPYTVVQRAHRLINRAFRAMVHIVSIR